MSSNQPSPTGWCPFATRVNTTKFWSGNQGRRAVCLHIAQGTYDATVTWLSDAQLNPNSSAHFVIAKDGRIAQLVSINDSAWANGLAWDDTNKQWLNPRGVPVTPSWVDLIAGVNPNYYTISIEHEGVYTDTWTPEMYAANDRLMQWLATQINWVYVPHRNVIGHYELDPVDRANCPGPNVNYVQIANDANNGLLVQVKPQPLTVHVYGSTPLVSLPDGATISQLQDTDLQIYGYLSYQNKLWYITPFSFQNFTPNFFDALATWQNQTSPAELCLNPGFRDAVTPGADELRALNARWLRVLITSSSQNVNTGQNGELDWLLNRFQGMGVNVVVLLNTETVNETPPPHGTTWGDDNSGYIGKVSTLAQRVASFYEGKLAAIEIWNEPDVQQIDPTDYANMLVASYKKIKAVSRVPVLLGGICCGESFDYLQNVVNVAQGFYDGVGWHPYAERVGTFPTATWGFGDLGNSLRRARQIGGKPLWLTEIGADTQYDWAGNTPDLAIAEYLTRVFNLVRSLGPDSIAHAFWFAWRTADDRWSLNTTQNVKRPAWFAFQTQARRALPAPSANAPTILAVTLSPTSLDANQLLNVSITVRNDTANVLPTMGPDPGFVYDEGDSFQSRGFTEISGAYRVGIDFDGRTGIDHPYRWGFGTSLASGETRVVSGQIRLKSGGTKNYWAGLVRELVVWLQDRQGVQAITVTSAPPPPPTGKPTIIAVNFAPTTLDANQFLNVNITVRNDTASALPTMGPNPGFVYEEGDTFRSRGFVETSGAYRVGVDFDGRTGVDHPYRWGFGSSLAPGEARVISGQIHLKTAGAKNYWAGLVQEQIVWLEDTRGVQLISVNAPPPPPSGQLEITGVLFEPTAMDQGQVLKVTVTLKNNSAQTIATQGPNPNFQYNEGDNYLTKNFPPVTNAYRIGLDYDGRTGIDHPYRWGFGTSLAPGQSTTVSGLVRLNRKQKVNYWVALIQEGVGIKQDQKGVTLITVNPA